MKLDNNFHVCFVCYGNRVLPGDKPCPLCSGIENSVPAMNPKDTLAVGGGGDNTDNFSGFDIPWDLR